MRTKATLSEPSVNALLADTSIALLAGILVHIEKQLKLIPTSSQTSNSNMKSYTHHIKQMYNRKKTYMSISFNINIQRTNTKTMNLNQPLLLIQISVHGCSYTALCFSSLYAHFSIMLQYTMRVSISYFPLAT
jgi:NAD-specific glutamate dehydrogenase